MFKTPSKKPAAFTAALPNNGIYNMPLNRVEAKKASGLSSVKKVMAAKSSLPALDYDGSPLTSETAKYLRNRFAPKDETKTVWF